MFYAIFNIMKKIISALLKTLGVIFISLALVMGWASFNSFIERINNGSGLMFADAEIFLVLTLFFLFIGIVCFGIERKLKKTDSHN